MDDIFHDLVFPGSYNGFVALEGGLQHILHKSACAATKEKNMKIIKKLKALFFKDDRPISLDLAAAEIKEGRAYLHPKEDRTITYLVKSDDIEVRLSKGKSLTDKDIMIIGKRKKAEKEPGKPEDKIPKPDIKKNSTIKTNDPSDPGNVVYDFSRFKKKTFSVSLYPEEYDRLVDTIQKSGYKRSEFILASSVSATEKRMASAQKK